MRRFVLYGTEACHLCEQALGLLEEAGVGLELTLEEVDISEDDGLFERYGLTIPVLRHPDGAELGWPFDVAQLRAFLAS